MESIVAIAAVDFFVYLPPPPEVVQLLSRWVRGIYFTLPLGIGIYPSRKTILSSLVVIEKVKLTIVNSGTSPASNYAEACAAESKKDFVHKLGIALKELRESRTWVKLILKSEMLSDDRITPLLDECIQLCNIIGKSVVTAKASLPKSK